MSRKFGNIRLPSSLDYETTNERPVYTYIGFFEENHTVYKTALDKLKAANEKSNKPSIGDWTCKSCLYERNDILLDKCRLCAVPKDPQWICSHCTKFNYMEFELCVNCNNPRNSLEKEKKEEIMINKKNQSGKKADANVNISSTKTNDMWICTQCTLENTYANATCTACYMFNEKLEQESRLNTDYWKCDMCTFENNLTSEICDICKGSKPKEDLKNTGSLRKRNMNRFLPVIHNNCDEQCCQKTNFIETELFEKRKYDDRLNGYKEWKAKTILLKKSGAKYVDKNFPANTKSLFYNGKCSQNKSNEELNTEIKQINTTRIIWSRPNKLLSTEKDANIQWQLFRTPMASDISQGILGDCWLLSALSVIAERENLVRDIFITPEICEQGIYTMRLCKDGEWINVTVDDLLPCNKNGMLLYSQAKRKQLWVPLIEKAIAKLHGCYESLVSGRSIEGLATLTGAPCESISLYSKTEPQIGNEEFDVEMIWAKLLSSHQAMFLMGASCGGGLMIVDEEEWKRKGLRPRHAYAVLDVRDIRGCRLLQMRNPWGHYSWTGDWSDNSILWSPEMRELLMPLGASGGIFWISFEDVLKYFDSIDICKTRMNYSEIRLKGVLPSYSKPDSMTCFLLTIYEMTEVYFNLFQKGQRNSEKSKRQQLDLCIAIFECDNSNNRKKGNHSSYMLGPLIEHSKRRVNSFVGCEKMLKPNTYIVLCMAFNHWGSIPVASNDTIEFPDSCLVLQSSKRVIVEKFVPDEYILADAIIALTLKYGKPHEGREGMTTYYLTKGWAGLVVVVENRHSNKWIHVKCDCQESYNVVSTRGSLITVDSVPPVHRQVIIVLTQLGGNYGFSIAHRLMHRLSNQKALFDWAIKSNNQYKCDNRHFPIINNVRGLHAPRRL